MPLLDGDHGEARVREPTEAALLVVQAATRALSTNPLPISLHEEIYRPAVIPQSLPRRTLSPATSSDHRQTPNLEIEIREIDRRLTADLSRPKHENELIYINSYRFRFRGRSRSLR